MSSSPGHDEVITDPISITTLVNDHGRNLRQTNVQVHEYMRFDVYNDDYEQFIENIRETLRHSDSHGIPVLMPQNQEPTPQNTQWLDIELVAGDRSITVKLDQSNLYVRGYKRSPDNFFWEFRDSHLIDGSRDMKFSGSYVERDSIVKTADMSREEVPLGYSQLESAVINLVKLENPLKTNNKPVAQNLLVLIQMTAEAARFRTISQYIIDHYYYHEGVKISTIMAVMEKGWGDLSTAMLQLGPNPNPNTLLPNIPADNPCGVCTFEQAVAALGILLIVLPKEGLTTTMNVDYGRNLMNLEYVRAENPGGLCDAVVVDDGWYTYTFYDRSSGGSQNVGPGGFVTLTDSSHPFPVSGADSFIISVDKDAAIVWDRFVESVSFRNYDKHLQQMVKGAHGDATVGYSVLSNALGVTIDVILEYGGDGEGTAEINGTVRASQVLAGSAGLAPITLFEKSSEEYVEVGQGKAIPLTRKVIAGSTSVKLTVTADLWDYDPLSPNNGIAQGSVDFTVQPGTQRQYIDGRYGQVQVIITCE